MTHGSVLLGDGHMLLLLLLRWRRRCLLLLLLLLLFTLLHLLRLFSLNLQQGFGSRRLFGYAPPAGEFRLRLLLLLVPLEFLLLSSLLQ